MADEILFDDFIVPARLIRAAMAVADPKDVRERFRYILVNDDATVSATDGMTAFIGQALDRDVDDPARRHLLRLYGKIPPKANFAHFHWTEPTMGQVRCCLDDEEGGDEEFVVFERIEETKELGEFPNVAGFFSNAGPAKATRRIGLAPGRLAQISKVFGKGFITAELHGAERGVVVESIASEWAGFKARMLIMPTRLVTDYDE